MFRLKLFRCTGDALSTLIGGAATGGCRRTAGPGLELDRAPAVAACWIWMRLVSQYQFRTTKQAYYPDRQREAKRPAAGSTPQQVTSPAVKSSQGRGMPKDYYYKVLGTYSMESRNCCWLRRSITTQVWSSMYDCSALISP